MEMYGQTFSTISKYEISQKKLSDKSRRVDRLTWAQGTIQFALRIRSKQKGKTKERMAELGKAGKGKE